MIPPSRHTVIRNADCALLCAGFISRLPSQGFSRSLLLPYPFSDACPVFIACCSSTSGFRLPSPSICPFRAFLSLIPFSRICRFLPLSRFYPFPFHFISFPLPLPLSYPPHPHFFLSFFLFIFYRKFVSLENIATFAKDLHEEKRPGDPTAGLRCRIVRYDPYRNTDIEPPASGCMTRKPTDGRIAEGGTYRKKQPVISRIGTCRSGKNEDALQQPDRRKHGSHPSRCPDLLRTK